MGRIPYFESTSFESYVHFFVAYSLYFVEIMDTLLFAYAFVTLLFALCYAQPASNSFNIISFQANSVPVFDIRGSGQSIWHQGGITIETGGLRVLKGGKLFDLKEIVSVVFRSS
jgi:hypothetical protein